MQKTKIEWTQHTWNPVVGCKNNCWYCYAKKMNNRFKWIKDWQEPQINMQEMLNPKNEPKKASKIFVCSIADLFGNWIDDSTIEMVLNYVKNNPQHIFQFLTKNPKRYWNIKFPNNCWIGTTVTGEKIERTSYYPEKKNIQFLSLEPFFGLLADIMIRRFDWVIVGAMTGAGSQEQQPFKKWIDVIVRQCNRFNIPIFMKNSLSKIWDRPLIQEFPK